MMSRPEEGLGLLLFTEGRVSSSVHITVYMTWTLFFLLSKMEVSQDTVEQSQR